MSNYAYDHEYMLVEDYAKEVESLEAEIHDLREEIEARADDEVFTLAEIMLARDKLLEGGSVYEVIEDLNKLIGYHHEEIRVAAIDKINETEVA